MHRNRLIPTPYKESGAVLITGLIFMVVLTIIVTAALRSVTLEERMAANARNRQMALQAAEAVLRDAEASLFAATPFEPFAPGSFTATCASGYCGQPIANSTPKWQAIDWGSTALTRTFAATSSNLASVSSQPRYIVELIGYEGGQPGGAICPKVLFRITARGVGADSSTVFVQSMYRHRPATFADGSCG